MFEDFGALLIIAGVFLIILGVITLLAGGFHWFGRLPGDILIEKNGMTFYFPFATSVILSVVFSVVYYFMTRR